MKFAVDARARRVVPLLLARRGPLNVTMANASLVAHATATGGHAGHDGGVLGERPLPSGCEPDRAQRGTWGRSPDADAGLAGNPPRLLS